MKGPHCERCHSPMTFAFSTNKGKSMAGAVIDGARAYNISSDTTLGIGAWTTAQLVHYLGDGHATEHGAAGPSMGEVVQNSTSRLTDRDLLAIATYLKGVPPENGTVEIATTSTTPPAETPRSPSSTASTSRRALTACTCPASRMRTPMPRSRPSYVTSTPHSDTQAHRLIAKASERHAPMSSSPVRQPPRLAPRANDHPEGARTTSSIRKHVERRTTVWRSFPSSGMSLTARVDQPDQQAMDLILSAPGRVQTRGEHA